MQAPLTRGRHLLCLLRQQAQRAAHAGRRQRRQPRAASTRPLELLMYARDALLEVGGRRERAVAACGSAGG